MGGCDGSVLMYGWRFGNDDEDETDDKNEIYPRYYKLKTGPKHVAWDLATWELIRCEGDVDTAGVLDEDKKSLRGGDCRKAIIAEELPVKRDTWSADFTAELFTVTADVSGLEEGLELTLTNNQNERGDKLTVTANGAKTFAYSLAKGSRYSVQLTKISEGWTCAAAGPTGRISADVIVSVTCGKQGADRAQVEVAAENSSSRFSKAIFVVAILGYVMAVHFIWQKRQEQDPELVHLLADQGVRLP